MSLAYPLAITAEEALKGTSPAARTRYEAEDVAGETAILSLETEWLKPASNEVDAIQKQAQSGDAKGFIQIYEDADGKPVLAVTYWKLAAAPKPAQRPETTEAQPSEDRKPAARKASREDDHTDDLYFRHDRGRKSRRKKHVDPRQMDLFVSPDPRGYEHKDPNNPNTMLTDEEGDGTTFGG
ncbi:hypothetical protein [Henriciella sp.]|uniref:hypothetical protein n=1 Tax=Henriciella sp. TaxID=1968823 RepID=UPI002611FE6E|nr:hypothetical protein [Henriciella sp.]